MMFQGADKYKLTQKTKIRVIFVFIYWLIYENFLLLNPTYFFGPIGTGLVYSYKFFFPFFFLFSTGFPYKQNNKKATVFGSISGAFLLLFWSVIPTFLFGDLISWVKLIPPFIFYVASISFFLKNKYAILFLSKIFIGYVILTLVQYFSLYLFEVYAPQAEGELTGPMGLLGNTRSRINLGAIPIFRLCGFWIEPSNASATAFASFFMAKLIYYFERDKKWVYLSRLCLLAGCLTLSNAGYLGFSFALLFGVFFSVDPKKGKYWFRKLPLIITILAISFMAVIGRSYFVEIPITQNNYFIMGMAGIRSAHLDKKNFDPSDGRLELMNYTTSKTMENVWGLGIQTVGKKLGKEGKKIRISASAPLYWLLLSGIPGLLFLLLRDFSVYISLPSRIKKFPSMIYVVQAFLCILVQQLSYGSWMDPNYLIYLSLLCAGFTLKKDR